MKETPRAYRLSNLRLAFYSRSGCLKNRLFGLGESAMVGCVELA